MLALPSILSDCECLGFGTPVISLIPLLIIFGMQFYACTQRKLDIKMGRPIIKMKPWW